VYGHRSSSDGLSRPRPSRVLGYLQPKLGPWSIQQRAQKSKSSRMNAPKKATRMTLRPLYQQRNQTMMGVPASPMKARSSYAGGLAIACVCPLVSVGRLRWHRSEGSNARTEEAFLTRCQRRQSQLRGAPLLRVYCRGSGEVQSNWYVEITADFRCWEVGKRGPMGQAQPLDGSDTTNGYRSDKRSKREVLK